ncbi:MAG: DUF3040 domain-containing protein [Nocardioidaceae bacterium]
MLSDRDRERLREIQRRFVTEDPAFVREFEARPQQPEARTPQMDRYAIGLVSVTALSVLTLLAGWLAPALLFACLAGLVWVAQSRPRDHQPPGP